LAYSALTLRIEAACSSKTSVNFDQTTLHILEDYSFIVTAVRTRNLTSFVIVNSIKSSTFFTKILNRKKKTSGQKKFFVLKFTYVRTAWGRILLERETVISY
jgi:hypothetical protein